MSFDGAVAKRRAGVLSCSAITLLVLVVSACVAIAIVSRVTLGGDSERLVGSYGAAFLGRMVKRLEGGVAVGEGGGGGSLRAAPAAPLRGTLGDPDPIHIAWTLCGDPNEVEKDHYGLLGVKSLLMSKAHSPGAERHYVFHFVVNIPEGQLFNTTRLNWEVYRALRREVAAGRVTFHIYHISELDRAVQAVLGPTNPNRAIPHHFFKNCAASRLKLPFLLGGKVDRILYIDWDAVTLCDLTRLWAHWDSLRDTPNAVVGFALNDPSGVSDRDAYRMYNRPRHAELGSINSGVMMLHIGRLHARQRAGTIAYWDALRGIIASRVNVTGKTEVDYWTLTKAFPYGDQDVFNALFAAPTAEAPWGHPEWLFVLPEQYNVCIDPPFLEDMAGHTTVRASFARPPPCVVHYCGNRLHSNDGSDMLDVRDPTQATWVYFRHWQLEKPEEPPGFTG